MKNGVYNADDNTISEEFREWAANNNVIFEVNRENGEHGEVLINTISFATEDDRALYLLSWTEDLPIRDRIRSLRGTISRILAADIIGVQPMTGPSAQIFSLRARYLDETK